jgi:iron complex outermembrane recepter protein
MRNSMRKTVKLLLLGATILAGVNPAFSQNSSANTVAKTTSAEVGIDEIIVTATRKDERLQDVPIAVSAIGGDALDRGGVVSQQALAQRVPSFTFSDFAPGQSILSIRGVSSTDDGAATDSSVAQFVDDVYVGRLSNQAFQLFDLERIEVLRGPQGTLYGKNAIGGAINIVSTPVSKSDFKAKAKVSYGNYNALDVGALATGPITDNIAFKASLNSSDRDGWVSNVVTGNKVRNIDSIGARASLLFHNDSLSFQLNADYSNEKQLGIGRFPIKDGSAPLLLLHRLAGGNGFDIATNAQDGPSIRTGRGVSGKLIADLGGGTFTSITAYRKSASEWEMDSTGVPDINVIDEIDDFTKQFSQEVRYDGRIGDNLDYTVGAYYLNEKTNRREQFHLVFGIDDRLRKATSLAPITDLDDDVDSTGQINATNSYAAFANANWKFAEQWTVGAGLRYTHETKNLTNISRAGAIGAFGIIRNTFTVNSKASFSDVSPKFTLQFQPDKNLQIYANVGRGFKSGGFAAAPSTVQDAVRVLRPETAWSYELGLKADWFDRRLRTNLATFYTNYKDLQTQRFGPPLNALAGEFGRFQTLNAGNARLKGIEAEITAIPFQGLTLAASYSFLSATYKNFTFVDQNGNAVDLSGQTLVRAPKNKVSLSANFEHAGPAGGTMNWYIDYRYTGFQRGDIASPETNQPAFNVSDANVSYTSKDSDWTFSLWGRNIFKERYLSHIYIIGPGDIGVFGEPRTYGASVTWKM